MNHLDHSVSHARRVLCTTTLAILAGTVTALAQSGAGSGSGAGAGGAGSSTYNQSSSGMAGTGAGTTTSRRDTTSAQGTSSTIGTQNQTGTSGTYSTGSTGSTGTSRTGTRSGSTDSSYGTTGTTSGTKSMAGSSTDKLSWGDKRFVTKAADHGQSEVQLAQLAVQQASNPEVRRFAQKLVNDHTRVNSELMSLASNKNVEVEKNDGQDRTYRRLSNRQGQDFDQEFIEQMIDMHEADVKLFEKVSEDAKDQEIRSFASRHVGHLREHLQQAQTLRSTISPTGRDNNDASVGASTSTSSTTANPSGASDSDSGAYQMSGSRSHSTESTVADPTASGRDASRRGNKASGDQSDASTSSSSSSSTR